MLVRVYHRAFYRAMEPGSTAHLEIDGLNEPVDDVYPDRARYPSR